MKAKTIKHRIQHTLLLLYTILACGSCGKSYIVPENATANGQKVVIYPDYTDVTIPPNIAPLNFIVKSDAIEYVVEAKAQGKQVMVAGGDKDGVVQFDSVEWRETIRSNKGKELELTIYENKDGRWAKYNPYTIYIAQEDIDPYLSYRLIEPGFEMYRQVGLYQRNLTNFTQNIIYENNRSDVSNENHCVNCHNYQNYGGGKMLFHVRANMGGTMIAKDGKIEKLNFKNDSILGSAVYPSWHPTKNYIVFSSNRTGQAFHMADNEKVEVLDYGSDLLFYNADTHEVSNIITGDYAMETFPCWAPDGKKIYFCQADVPDMVGIADSMKISYVLQNYREIRYNVMSVSFDEKTMSFGTPNVEVDCVSHGKSATVPRISPDGKYLLFTLGDFGQFHIWHKSSDQWVKCIETGETYPLTEANSDDVDSYHSWSSNGRWMVFSSRRDDGNFTRPYIAYFDEQGRTRKAFMLPQDNPMQNLMLLKSYNVPELTSEPAAYSFDQFKEVVYGQNPGTDIKYKELRTPEAISEQKARNSQSKLLHSGDSRYTPEERKDTFPSQTDAVTGATKRADATSGATPKAK